MPDWTAELAELDNVSPRPEVGERIQASIASVAIPPPRRVHHQARRYGRWLAVGVAGLIVLSALALAAHTRRTPSTRQHSVSPVIHDGHTRIIGGSPQQRAAMRKILLGIDSKQVPSVRIGPPPANFHFTGNWLVYNFPGSTTQYRLGQWESWLVSGAFNELSRRQGLPAVKGVGQLFHPGVGSNFLPFSNAQRSHHTTSDANAETLTRQITARAEKAHLTILSIRFAKTIHLAPIVIAQTNDPRAKLGKWEPPLNPIGDDSNLDGGYFEVINSSRQVVFIAAHSTWLATGMGST